MPRQRVWAIPASVLLLFAGLFQAAFFSLVEAIGEADEGESYRGEIWLGLVAAGITAATLAVALVGAGRRVLAVLLAMSLALVIADIALALLADRYDAGIVVVPAIVVGALVAYDLRASLR